MATTMVAPGIDGVLADFDVSSPAVSTLAVTIFLFGLAMGPMFLSSLGEVYGRLPVYHAANIVFIAFMIGNALSKNIAQFMIFRFISGCAGGMPLAMGGGTIADVTLPAKRLRHCIVQFRAVGRTSMLTVHPSYLILTTNLYLGARPCYRRLPCS